MKPEELSWTAALNRIAELEAENKRLDKLGPVSRRQWLMAMDDLRTLKAANQQFSHALEIGTGKVLEHAEQAEAALNAQWEADKRLAVERIAELEADYRNEKASAEEWYLEAQGLEAELAALKDDGYCTNPQWDHGALCDRWTARAEEGGE